jgi:hypothetical protein
MTDTDDERETNPAIDDTCEVSAAKGEGEMANSPVKSEINESEGQSAECDSKDEEGSSDPFESDKHATGIKRRFAGVEEDDESPRSKVAKLY